MKRKFNFSKDRIGDRTVFEKYPSYLRQYHQFHRTEDPESKLEATEFLGADEFQTARKVLENVVRRPGRSLSDFLKHLTALRQFCLHHGMPESHPMMQEIVAEFKSGSELRDQEEKKNQLGDSVRDQHWKPMSRLMELLALVEKRSESGEYRALQQRLLLQMLLLHPPWRHNFHTVHLTDHPETLSDDCDWITRKDGKLVMHLGHDKTVDTYGRVERELHPEIEKTLALLAKHGARSFLLTGKSLDQPLGLPGAKGMDASRYLLSSITDEEGNPARLTVNNIRSAAATAFMDGNRSMADKENYAREMRTSLEMLEKFYHKVL